MDLSGLLPLLSGKPGYQELLAAIGSCQGTRGVVIPDAAKPFLLACLRRDLGVSILVVTARSDRARQLQEETAIWLGSDAGAKLLPEPDALPYERLSSDQYTVQQRLRVLSSLNEDVDTTLIVASAYAVARKTIAPAGFASSSHILRTGTKVDLEQLLARWIALGYEMESTVELPGTVSRRGGIIDIFPPNSDLPARIELLGNEVESIRLFDPASQRSVELARQIAVIPAREMLAPLTDAQDLMRGLGFSTLGVEARAAMESDIASMSGGVSFDGYEFYAALVNDGALPDYLPAHSLVVLDEPDLIESALRRLDDQAGELRRLQTRRGEMPGGWPVPYLTWHELQRVLGRFDRRLDLEQWSSAQDPYPLDFGPAPAYVGRLPAFLEEARDMLRAGRRIVVVSQQGARLSDLLGGQDIIASPVSDLAQLPPSGSLALVPGSLSEGWVMDGVAGSVILTDVELFGVAKKRRAAPKHPVRREAFLAELATGDYVVHIDHGVARFAGLSRLDLGGGEREYLLLEYASGDKLYVPSEQVDRVSRYIGPGGYVPSLSRLGTQEWHRAKQRVKEAAVNLARELLSLYSARQVMQGIAFSSDTAWQQELEASFPYVETQDQLGALRDVKRDMESLRPMDRLVCGDVGYGKTEIALRAAFKAVMDGMQVAVLVPTTVLAQQHMNTFRERLGAFPVRIELLSRFRSPREQHEVVQALANGSVDICIGTHRLVQRDVSFKNLGLVIIDEEQRFGVAHKERLKQLRQEVDVMTLSATPIPRTLHMSLIGVRDMSTMETPPEDRLPIKTYVGPYDERTVREAILRELERNGQVFYVHNRVQKIDWLARRLERLVPEARLATAHGQMPEEVLESVMLDFAQGKVDVLVCTTIIESGLDLPNVNTLIVDDADKMGLTQLYQLRGRVGRGANRAYAYFLYGKGKELTEAARKRLKTIFEATELGAGFRIAIKDLEIRGAGNLLGPEQSGQMGAVGFDLYCRLLSDAVEDLKTGTKPEAAAEAPATTVDLPIAAFIPEEYVADQMTRLALYMRIAQLSTPGEVAELAAELEDRFGPLPRQVKDLLYMVRVKLLGSDGGVREIYTDKGQVVLKLGTGVRVDREGLHDSFGDRLRIGTSQIRIDTKRPGRKWKDLLEQVVTALASSTGARGVSEYPSGS